MQHDSHYNQNVRGYRNNNPLNLRISSNNWKGKIKRQENTDGAFEQFETMTLGFRAALVNIRTQITRGYNTIDRLIRIWAPENDGNNTENYIRRVCKTTGFERDVYLNELDPEDMGKLMYAMALVENGSYPQWDDITEALNMVYYR